MLKFRWLSTFTIIGAILLVLGIVGLVSPHFVYDPGQVSYDPSKANDHSDAWYYLAIGVLMIINGLVMPAPLADDADESEQQGDKAPVVKPAPKAGPREAMSAAQEKAGE